MTIKHLFPASLPELNLDFANAKQLDPRITFSRASTGTYTDENGIVQTAAVDEARFDHAGDGTSLGLLIEEARTNLFTYSEDFSQNPPWILISVTGTPASGTAPDGANTATLVECTVTSNAYLRYTITTTGTSTISAYLKAGTSGFGALYCNGGTAEFNLTTGTFVRFTGAGNHSGSITSLGNGWHRCTLTTDASANQQKRIIVINADGSVTADPGDNILVWGAQLEEGASFPTSYIPTAGATATRAADFASMTGTNFSSWYNLNEGTIYVRSDTSVTSSTAAAIIAEGIDGSAARDFTFNIGNLKPNFTTRYPFTALDIVLGSDLIHQGVPFNFVGAYSSLGSAACFEGGTVETTGLPVSTLSPATGMTIGCRGLSSLFLNGHISRIAYYPVRLPDEQLQALTA